MWRTYKLGDILKRRKSVAEILPEKDYKLVTIKLYHKGICLRSIAKGSTIKSKMSFVKAGDFLVSGIDARNGAFGIAPDYLEGAVITNDFWCLEPDGEIIDKQFLFYLTSTVFFDRICKESSDGTTQRIRLQKDKFFDYQISLPELPDQRKLLNKLKQVNNLGDLLRSELLHQINLIIKLRQSILRDAVQGKLVPQDKNDELASELLKRIKAEKEKLVAEGKLKKEKLLPPITKEELPFELPKGWVWCRLGEVIDLISGQHIDANNYNEKGNGTPYLTGPSDFGAINPVFSRWSELPKVIVNKDDILITVKGSGVGKTNILHWDEVAIGRQLMAIRSKWIEKRFLKYFIDSLYDELQSEKSGIAIPGICREDISHKLFGMPPLQEQCRAVLKVEELMKLCDKMESHLVTSRETAQKLMESVLKEAFENKHEPKKQKRVLNAV